MRSMIVKRVLAGMLVAGFIFGGFGLTGTPAAYAAQTPTHCPRQDHCGELALRRMLFHETVLQTGLPAQAVENQLRTGRSLSEIAAQHGSSQQAVVSATLHKLNARLSQAVANGRITAAQKAQIMAHATQRAPIIMNHHRNT